MFISPLFILFTFSRQAPLVVARKFFAPGLMWIAGAKLTVIGQENVPKDKPVVFVANHASHLDIGCLCAALPVNLHFIGKKELMYFPIVGWYMFLAGHIFIDRKSRVKAASSLKQAALKIREGKSVVMYPEGTRSETGEIGVFKKGAFHLAKEAGVQVVPVSIKGTEKVWPKSPNKITPGNVTVKIGKPIDSSDFSKEQLNDFVVVARTAVLAMHKG
jgi:1-acyl-sn-glycerol-3-phosphate acyltransferase